MNKIYVKEFIMGSIFFFMFIILTCLDAQAGSVEDINRVLPFSMAMGYEQWVVNWEVEGFSYDIESNEYSSDDYNIDPTLIRGVFVSTSSRNTGKSSWTFSLSAYGDYIRQENEDAMDSHVKYLKGFFSFGITDNTALYSQYQSGIFQGELVGKTRFESEFKKLGLLLCGANPKRSIGIGLRFLTYNLPVEFAFVDHETGDDLGHAVYQTETKGVSFMLRSMDPIALGYDNNKLYFIDYDFAFGISKADAKELIDNVYGFQFNCELDAGLKGTLNFGENGLIALKAGYRIFFDSQILAEWEGSDDQNTTSTLRNVFHGPFISVVGAF
ncbi:MAG: hypothetical protein KKD44_25310 [Proteobacteria bacterium]|nr:hypothetical protein [Pseudomonadota bacterium]